MPILSSEELAAYWHAMRATLTEVAIMSPEKCGRANLHSGKLRKSCAWYENRWWVKDVLLAGQVVFEQGGFRGDHLALQVGHSKDANFGRVASGVTIQGTTLAGV